MKSIRFNISDSNIQSFNSLELDGLYEPPPVAFAFETIGWAVLLGVSIVFAFIWMIYALRIYIKNKYRRDAIAQIEKLENDPVSILVVLKRVAIHRYGRKIVAPLTGEKWLEYLDETAHQVQFLKMNSNIEKLLYEQVELDTATRYQLSVNAVKWIKTHA
ncbi:DUF4381 domain-containing protein [Reichenbachiella sp.]|uniref:DUF4381 domain-containing protein n=1 Tax=Reichenbachiella sp. TaxID=2184521 RepID=UPI003B5B0DED